MTIGATPCGRPVGAHTGMSPIPRQIILVGVPVYAFLHRESCMTYSDTQLRTHFALKTTRRGSGIPLLLIHGFPLDHSIWEAQAEALSRFYWVIMPDLRGHGRSPAPEGAYSMDLMARDIMATLDRLGIERAIWVGHSMGGYITMAAWRLAPQRVARLALVSTNHLADTDEARQKRYDIAKEVSKTGSAEPAINPNLFASTTSLDAPYVKRTFDLMRKTSPVGVIGSLLGMASRPDSTETLKSINVPSLVIGGADEQLIPAERAKEMADLLPNGQLVMMDKAGHMPMLEQPEAVSDALFDLMR